MKFFTENHTIEKMMQEIPRGRDESPASLPVEHHCYGCTNYGGCCFALCHRKEKLYEKEQEKTS